MTKEQVYEVIETHYREYFDSYVKRLSSGLGQPAAEDAVQNAYLDALENWEKFARQSKNGDFGSWFLGKLLHAVRDIKKDQKTHGIVNVPGQMLVEEK